MVLCDDPSGLNAGVTIINAVDMREAGRHIELGRKPALIIRSDVNIMWMSDSELILESLGDVVFEEGARIKNIGSGRLTVKADSEHRDNGGKIYFQGDGPVISFSGGESTERISFMGNRNEDRSTNSYVQAIRAPPTVYGFTYYVQSSRDLLSIAQYPRDRYELTGDLDVGEVNPLFNEENPFRGDFSGDNHTIRFRQDTDVEDGGLFGAIRDGLIYNLNLNGDVISRGARVGLLGGLSQGHERRAQFYNIRGLGKVEGGRYIGGLIGLGERTDFKGCEFLQEGEVIDISHGAVLDITRVNILRPRKEDNPYHMGGIIGSAEECLFEGCKVKNLVLGDNPRAIAKYYQVEYYPTGLLEVADLGVQNRLREFSRQSTGDASLPLFEGWVKQLWGRNIGGIAGSYYRSGMIGSEVSKVVMHLEAESVGGGMVGKNYVETDEVEGYDRANIIHSSHVEGVKFINPKVSLLGALIGYSQPALRGTIKANTHRIIDSDFREVSTNDEYFNTATELGLKTYPLQEVGFSRLIDEAQYEELKGITEDTARVERELGRLQVEAQRERSSLELSTGKYNQAVTSYNYTRTRIAETIRRINRLNDEFWSWWSGSGARAGVEESARFLEQLEKRLSTYEQQAGLFGSSMNGAHRKLGELQTDIAIISQKRGGVTQDIAQIFRIDLKLNEIKNIEIPQFHGLGWLPRIVGTAITVGAMFVGQYYIAPLISGVEVSLGVIIPVSGGSGALTFAGLSKSSLAQQSLPELPSASNIRVTYDEQQLSRTRAENSLILVDSGLNLRGNLQIEDRRPEEITRFRWVSEIGCVFLFNRSWNIKYRSI